MAKTAKTRLEKADVDPFVRLPRSVVSGIGWPALPSNADALILSLQYQFDISQWWPQDSLRKMQMQQAEMLVSYAHKTTPFYKDRLKDVTTLKRGTLTLEDFRKIPLLRRAEIQDAGPALFSRQLPKSHGKTSEIKTSGSTGRPITVKTTHLKTLFFQAANLRYHLWHNRDLTAKTATIRILTGRRLENAEKGRASVWAPAHRSGPMVSFNVTRPLSEQIAWLEKENPEYFLTNPSNLRALIECDSRAGGRMTKLRHVATMGEVMDPDIRQLCETHWGVPVIDVYSSQEIGFLALQCPDHAHYHVMAEESILEVLDENGGSCAPGETGRVVITDLHNFAMPLIRYEIGDYAEVGEPCPCGRGLPVLNRILGRTRNMLTLPSGEKVWPQFGRRVFGTIPDIRQVQLVQRSKERIDINLVVTRPLTADEENDLRNRLADSFGHSFDTNFNYMDEIPRAASGKFEDFRSEV
ncbi:MAG: AMP-binding protein [Rhodospirillales bacterium]|nr:AMP-binding protein [Rhodospirillales bacterium]